MSNSGVCLSAAVAPVTRRVRAYFAPVARAAGMATVWDPAGIAGFDVDAPPSPWVDLGWCSGFARKSGTKVEALVAGAPGMGLGQVRTEVAASVALEFESWGKLQLGAVGWVPADECAADGGGGGGEWKWRRRDRAATRLWWLDRRLPRPLRWTLRGLVGLGLGAWWRWMWTTRQGLRGLWGAGLAAGL